MAAFETFDNTGDASVLAQHLADDAVFMPPGSPPVEGKEEIVESILEPFPADVYDVEQTTDALLVCDDLAVNRASTIGTKSIEDGEQEVSHKGLDVFRKDSDGTWKVAISIWNQQA